MSVSLSANAAIGTFKGVTIALDDPTLNGIVEVWEFAVFVKQPDGSWLVFHQEDNVVEGDPSQPGPLVAQAQQAGSIKALWANVIRPAVIADMVAAVNANLPAAPGLPPDAPLPTTEAEAMAQLSSILAGLKGIIPADANGMPTLP